MKELAYLISSNISLHLFQLISVYGLTTATVQTLLLHTPTTVLEESLRDHSQAIFFIVTSDSNTLDQWGTWNLVYVLELTS